MQHKKLEQELAIDSLLDKAFEQAIRGKLELRLLEGKQLNLRQSNRWETILNKNIQQKIAIKAKAERDSQPKPPPKPKPTRFLSAVDNAPRVGSMVAFEGSQVLITSLSETPWEFNSRQLEDQALAEFAGKLVTYVYYQPITEEGLQTARASLQD